MSQYVYIDGWTLHYVTIYLKHHINPSNYVHIYLSYLCIYLLITVCVVGHTITTRSNGWWGSYLFMWGFDGFCRCKGWTLDIFFLYIYTFILWIILQPAVVIQISTPSPFQTFHHHNHYYIYLGVLSTTCMCFRCFRINTSVRA